MRIFNRITILIQILCIITVCYSYHNHFNKIIYNSNKKLINKLYNDIITTDIAIISQSIPSIHSLNINNNEDNKEYQPYTDTIVNNNNNISDRLIVSYQSSISYIQLWAKETVSDLGKSIKAKDHNNGVLFTFSPSPGSYLDIAIYNNITNLTIKSKSYINSNNDNVISLIRFTTDNIIDSLINQINYDIINNPQLFIDNTIDNTEIKTIESSTDKSVDKSVDSSVDDWIVNQRDDSNNNTMNKNIVYNQLIDSIPNLSNLPYEEIEEDEDDSYIEYLNKVAKPIEMKLLNDMYTSNIPNINNLWKTDTNASTDNLNRVKQSTDNALDIDVDKHLDRKLNEKLDSKIASNLDTIDTKIERKLDSTIDIKVGNTIASKTDSKIDSQVVRNVVSNTSKNITLSEIDISTTNFPIYSKIHSWSDLLDTSSINSVIDYLAIWSNKYSDKGIGISSNRTTNGIDIFLAIDDNIKLSYVLTNDLSTNLTTLVSIVANTNTKTVTKVDSNINAINKLINNFNKILYNEIVTLKVNYIDKYINKSIDKQMKVYPTTGLEGFDSTNDFFNYVKSDDINDLSDMQTIDSKIDSKSDININSNVYTNPYTKQSNERSNRRYNYKDPEIISRANDIGIRLDSFEGKGLEEQAINELNNMIESNKYKGFYNIIKSFNNQTSNNQTSNNQSDDNIYSIGSNITSNKIQELLSRDYNNDINENITNNNIKLPMRLDRQSVSDIFDLSYNSNSNVDSSLDKQIDIYNLLTTLNITSYEINTIDKQSLELDKKRLDLLIYELDRTTEDRYIVILDSFKDLLLSDNIIYLLKYYNHIESNEKKRLLYHTIIQHILQLNNQLIELIRSESIKYLNIIDKICYISYHYQSNEQVFINEINALKSSFDLSLLQFIQYSIDIEYQTIRRNNNNTEVVPSQWLLILKTIQQAILSDYEVRYERLLEPLLIVIRFEQEDLRTIMLQRFINITAPIDLKYLQTLGKNMISSVLSNKTSLSDDVNLRNKLDQLDKELDIYLSDDYIDMRMNEFQQDATNQGVKIYQQHRNPQIQSDIELSNDIINDETKIGKSMIDYNKQSNR